MSLFKATETMTAFIKSPKHVRVLGGPIGGGKSVCCVHELLRWACAQQPNAAGERKTRFLICRNTADQLRSTTQKTFFDWVPPGVAGRWAATEKTFYLEASQPDGTIVKSEFMFIALDTPDDVRKALSLEATGLWGNESRELHPEVVDGLLMRVNRYPSAKDGGATRAGAIFDTNMPGDDSWWQDKMDNPPRNWDIFVQPPAALPVDMYIAKYGVDPDETLVGEDTEGGKWAVDPHCDNYAYLANGTGQYYLDTLEGKTPDFINVYLRCKYGRNLSGFPVYEKTFLPEIHIAEPPLKVIQSGAYPLTIGLDFGRTPAAVFGQMDPRGRFIILSEVTSENMGIERFVETKLKPHMFERYQGIPLRIAPDPAGWQKTQVGEVSPVDVLTNMGYSVVRPHTNLPNLRIEAVERMLTKFIDGKPAFLVDKSCTQLVKGFKTGYRWRSNKKGDLEGTTPEKNEYSHIHDALQYFALVTDVTSGYSVKRKSVPIKPAPFRWAR